WRVRTPARPNGARSLSWRKRSPAGPRKTSVFPATTTATPLAPSTRPYACPVRCRPGRWPTPRAGWPSRGGGTRTAVPSPPAAGAQRQHCLELIRKGQSRDGGWGPFVSSPPEPFDTAVVLLALASYREQAGWKGRLERGRAFLQAAQQEDGSWPETTRPAGA